MFRSISIYLISYIFIIIYLFKLFKLNQIQISFGTLFTRGAVRALAVRLLGKRASEYTLNVQHNTDQKHYALVCPRKIRLGQYIMRIVQSTKLSLLFLLFLFYFLFFHAQVYTRNGAGSYSVPDARRVFVTGNSGMAVA